MPDTKIIIKDIASHPETGHLTYTIYAESVDDGVSWRGPVKQYGCDQQMLRDRFHGNLEEFEAFIANEHKPYVGSHPKMLEALEARKGKVIGG